MPLCARRCRRRHIAVAQVLCRLFIVVAALVILSFACQTYQLIQAGNAPSSTLPSPKANLLLRQYVHPAASLSSSELALQQPAIADFQHFSFGGCNLTDVLRRAYKFRKKGRSAAKLKICDRVSIKQGRNVTISVCNISLSVLEEHDFHVASGGHYRPSHCIPRSKIAIIIPFRNRWHHLSDFLLNMHPFLQKQNIEYTVFVINQDGKSDFNRGMLLNIGAAEALKAERYDCFVFHDVDLLPEQHGNYYECPPRGGFRHMSVAVDKFDYELPYETLVGGVLAADRKSFEDVNGYSNLFFGWGGEDDDFAARLLSKNYTILRYDLGIARYRMLGHSSDAGNQQNNERFGLLAGTLLRSKFDGLNTLLYSVTAVEKGSLFTLVNVSIDQEQIVTSFFNNLAKSSLLRPTTA